MGSVIVAKYLSPFKKLIPSQHSLELLARHEMVARPVFLGPTRRAGGVGDAELEPRHLLKQPPNQSRLTAAGRGGDDEDRAHGRKTFDAETLRRRESRAFSAS